MRLDLTIRQKIDGRKMTLELVGELNTITAKELEKYVNDLDCDELILDFQNLSYITSAGIRLILCAKQTMDRTGGTMRIVQMCDEIKEIFEVVGLYDLFVF